MEGSSSLEVVPSLTIQKEAILDDQKGPCEEPWTSAKVTASDTVASSLASHGQKRPFPDHPDLTYPRSPSGPYSESTAQSIQRTIDSGYYTRNGNRDDRSICSDATGTTAQGSQDLLKKFHEVRLETQEGMTQYGVTGTQDRIAQYDATTGLPRLHPDSLGTQAREARDKICSMEDCGFACRTESEMK